MAKEKEPKKSDAAEGKTSKPKAESSNKLFVMMFAGVMIIQLVIIIVAVFFIFNKNSGTVDSKPKKEDTEKVEGEGEEKKDSKKDENEKLDAKTLPPFITKDLIINPKGTGGKRFLMTQVGIYLKAETEPEKEEIEKKWEAQFNSVINQYLSGKTIEELDDLNLRDSMAIEIKSKINEQVPGKKVQKIVFSKFAIQ
jgi:flagellar protein FliL